MSLRAPFCFGSSEEKGGENIMVKKVLIAIIVLLAFYDYLTRFCLRWHDFS